MAKRRIQYFTDFNQDIVQNADQNYQLTDDFQWMRSDWQFKSLSVLISFLAKIFGYGFCKLFLRHKFKNIDILKSYRGQGYFLYANHTQPIGDVFVPMLAGGALRFNVICAQANLGIPIIGPLLPYGGALPIPTSIHKLSRLINAVDCHIKRGDFITIYPEAHVWPYYSRIRPFSATAFHFPVEVEAPSFVMTNTYQKTAWRKRPQMISYIDGPLFPDRSLSRKEQQQKLMHDVEMIMKQRATLSNVEYIKYIKEEK